MSRTFRRQPEGVGGMREKVYTLNERKGRMRTEDEALIEGYDLSARRRELRNKWDDIRNSAAHEGRWFK